MTIGVGVVFYLGRAWRGAKGRVPDEVATSSAERSLRGSIGKGAWGRAGRTGTRFDVVLDDDLRSDRVRDRLQQLHRGTQRQPRRGAARGCERCRQRAVLFDQ